MARSAPLRLCRGEQSRHVENVDRHARIEARDHWRRACRYHSGAMPGSAPADRLADHALQPGELHYGRTGAGSPRSSLSAAGSVAWRWPGSCIAFPVYDGIDSTFWASGDCVSHASCQDQGSIIIESGITRVLRLESGQNFRDFRESERPGDGFGDLSRIRAVRGCMRRRGAELDQQLLSLALAETACRSLESSPVRTSSTSLCRTTPLTGPPRTSPRLSRASGGCSSSSPPGCLKNIGLGFFGSPRLWGVLMQAGMLPNYVAP